MNKYGRMMWDHARRFHPEALEAIDDPAAHFAEAGEEAEMAIAVLRDQLLDQQPRKNDPEALRLRSYQALRTAEEVVLADHPLLVVPAEDEDLEMEADPELVSYYRNLAEIDQALVEADEILRGPTP